MAKFSEDVSKRYQVGSSCVKLGTSWAKMRIGWAKMDPQFPRTAGQCLGNGQQNGRTRHSSQGIAYCWVLGGFQGFSYGQVLLSFHMVPSWAKLGQDGHKLGQDEDSSPELLGTGWGTGSKKGTRDAVPRELAGS